MKKLACVASAFALWLAALPGTAWAQLLPTQVLPVRVEVSGNVARATIGSRTTPLADVTLTFEDASGLTAQSLGLTARLTSLLDLQLLKRLPDLRLSNLDSAFPLLLSIEPPLSGPLRFRTVRAEIHTHALIYTEGTRYRLFKAPLGGLFEDITDEVARGSVRARGTTGGFSQFLILADLRPTGYVVAEKVSRLRSRIDRLPAAEQPVFDGYVDDVEAAVAAKDYDAALYSVERIAERARSRAGDELLDEWRASRNADNQAGDLIAGAATLRFSLTRLRDFGQ